MLPLAVCTKSLGAGGFFNGMETDSDEQKQLSRGKNIFTKR